jgi:drug/metabolite transporter (DMT)-like permease
VLLEFDLSADQDRTRLDPADHLHLGALADRRLFPPRDPAHARVAAADRCQSLEAVRPAADHQFDDPVSDDHLGAAICAASIATVLASTTPIFAFLITWGITRHEPSTLLRFSGAILGLAGTAVIIGLDALGGLNANIFPEIVILLATVSFACATIFGLRLSDYDPMVVAAGSLLFGGCVLLPVSLIVDHPWALHPAPQAVISIVTIGIFSSAFGLMLFYMCLRRLGTLTTNAQGYLRIPIGVGLSVVLLGETVPANLMLGLLLVMAGVAAMTLPGDCYGKWIDRLRGKPKD